MDDLRGLWHGKTTPKKNGEQFNNIWVEGDLIHSGNRYYIHPLTNAVKVQNELGRFIVMHEIVPSTLGECTGLHDKNGKLIFKGDVVLVNHPHNGTSIHEVIWDGYCWNLKGFYASCYDNPPLAFSEGTTYMTVIGNIHDNPELLKGEANENV